jgi:hypothetical protein
MHECYLNGSPYSSSVVYADGVVCPECQMTRKHRELQDDYEHLMNIVVSLKKELKGKD